MNLKRKDNYSFNLLSRSQNIVHFIEFEYFSKIKFQHGGELIDDWAYISIIQLLQVFAFELVLKSCFVKISKFNSYDDMEKQLLQIGHKLESVKLQDVFQSLEIRISKKETKKEKYFIVKYGKEKYIFYEFTWIRYLLPLRKNLGKTGLINKNKNTYKEIERNMKFLNLLSDKIIELNQKTA